jgi:hypothetical protein
VSLGQLISILRKLTGHGKMKITVKEALSEFPYGFLAETEGDYVERATKFLKLLPAERRALLLDLIDLQWVALIQQLWFIADETGTDEDFGKMHFVLARMQINSRLRRQHGLGERNMRNALMRFANCDLLVLLETADKRGTR